MYRKIVFLLFFFWSITSFFFSLMNSSEFALNLFSSKVSYSSFTMLYRNFKISISEFRETITVSSNSSLISAINRDQPSECGLFLDAKNCILKELFNNTFPHPCRILAECVGISSFEPNMNSKGQ